MKAMRAELAFFDEDQLLARSMILICGEKDTSEVISERGDKFEVTRQFEEPASVFHATYSDQHGELAGESAMRMGVHNSDDWEMVELAQPYNMCFKCAIVDCDNPDWAAQEPFPAGQSH